MKYVLIKWEEEVYWIEVGTDGYAQRQIVVDCEQHTYVSCLEDYLAEGIVDKRELDGTVSLITQEIFNEQWGKVTAKHRKEWESQKVKYSIGKTIQLKVAYHYPQGWIMKGEGVISIYCGELDISYDQLMTGRVIGYDEVNIWLRVSDNDLSIG